MLFGVTQHSCSYVYKSLVMQFRFFKQLHKSAYNQKHRPAQRRKAWFSQTTMVGLSFTWVGLEWPVAKNQSKKSTFQNKGKGWVVSLGGGRGRGTQMGLCHLCSSCFMGPTGNWFSWKAVCLLPVPRFCSNRGADVSQLRPRSSRDICFMDYVGIHVLPHVVGLFSSAKWHKTAPKAFSKSKAQWLKSIWFKDNKNKTPCQLCIV